MPRLILAGVFLGLLALPAFAQKAPLDHDAYDIWNVIDSRGLSSDGAWVQFSLGPEDGDDELRVVSSDGRTRHHVARGAGAEFSPENTHVVFRIAPPRDSVRQAKRDGKTGDALPKDSLGILDLGSGTVVKVPRVQSFAVPERGGTWIAYRLVAEDDSTAADSATAEAESEAESEAEADEDKNEKDKPEGAPLVLRNLASGAEHRFADVTEYVFTEDGRRLAFAASNEDGTADGLFVVPVETGVAQPVRTGEGIYRKPTWAESGRRLAFLSNDADFDAEQPNYALYGWEEGRETAEPMATVEAEGLTDGWWISEHGAVAFSDDGGRVFVGTAPRPEPDPDDELPEDERVILDIWSTTDPLLQPMQKLRADDERKRSYRAVVAFDDPGELVQLADLLIPDVTVAEEGNGDVALGVSDLPYRPDISWDYPGYHDAYVIDVETGARRQVANRIQSTPQLSPDGAYVTWWDRDALAWMAVSTDGGDPVDLTAAIPHAVHDETHDWPYGPNPYGQAGWTEGDDAFLVYDRYDLWAVDPDDPDAPRNVTDGRGRAQNIRLRNVRLDPEVPFVDPDDALLLSGFNYATKAAGFFRDRVNGQAAPEELLWMDRDFSTPTKARDADVLLFTRSTVDEFPDLWVSDPDFDQPTRISTANPQQSDYNWATVELVEWTSIDGDSLRGLIYKPEDFDPSRRYPMMVYFYEKNSDNLHQHPAQVPHRSIINPIFYASRGYVVFIPDIVYKIGYPGESAMHAVMPGVTHILDRGYVDPARVGVQGHSWGGYQIAYMVTQTRLFRAAEAGAPVANMTSAYGGIRWSTGLSRMFQYERTQSRLGVSLWENPLRYIENSPLFWVDKIETPLLIMHNDHDGAVPWYQGIELFVALRRLGKPAWLINYNDADHWPQQFQEKRDWQIRLQQYFDHYLKDAPAPAWMTEGIPAVDKGRTLGLEVPTDGE